MQSFVYQQGLPVVDLVREGSAIKATQSRYTMLGTHASATQWIIPFCVRRGATRSCTLIDQKSQPIASNGEGVLVPNAGGTGYYRYNLRTADWDALIAAGATLPAGEGLAASDSLWAQFSTGKVSASQLITAASTFVDNPDSNVAVHGGWQLAGWRERGWLPDASIADYRRVMSSIYKPRLTKLGFDPRAGAHSTDSPDDQKLRQDLLGLMADEAHDAPTRKSLQAAAIAYLGGDANALDQAFYEVAMRVHVQDGTQSTTQAMFDRLSKPQDELFRGALLQALGSNRRLADTQWLLAQFNDTRLRSTDKLELMTELMAHEETRDLAFDWLKAHYDEFAKGAGIFASILIPSLPETYCSVEKAAEIDRLLRPRVLKAGRGELPFDRMLENIKVCGTLKNSMSAEIAAALK
jgi:aminopeptidase N